MNFYQSEKGSPSRKGLPRRLLMLFAVIMGITSLQAEALSEAFRLQLLPDGKTGQRRFEMEHRPVPRRQYALNEAPASDVTGFLLRADGSHTALPVVSRSSSATIEFDSPWKNDALHGPNNVYVFDSSVHNNTLLIRTAKWIVIHHNCAWGHPYKYVEERLSPRSLELIPLEIVPEPLWDGNFHVSTETGMTLSMKVLSYGKPVRGAELTIVTDQGWQKSLLTDEHGMVSFQLIRDYYTSSWDEFNRNHVGALHFMARYGISERGIYQGQPYAQKVMTTTLSWRYRPAKADYSSLISGLFIVFITMMSGGVVVWLYRERRRKPARRLSFDE